MRFRLFLFVLILVCSCNNSGPSGKDIHGDTMSVEEEVFPGDKMIWIADYDTVKQQFFLKKQRTVNADTLTAETLVDYINAGWENIKLVYKKVSHDTLYVAIPDSDFLTQQMGDAGAEAYIASTTYNLTELKGIQFVRYDFTGGDHLSPGVFSREDFENFR